MLVLAPSTLTALGYTSLGSVSSIELERKFNLISKLFSGKLQRKLKRNIFAFLVDDWDIGRSPNLISENRGSGSD